MLWEIGSDDLAQEGVAGVFGMHAIATIVDGLQGKRVGHKRSPGINDVRRWIMGDDPVSKGSQVNAVPGCLKSVLHNNAVGLELSYEVRILRLPLAGRVTESDIISADHENGGGGSV